MPSPFLRPLLALLAGVGIIVLITVPAVLIMTLGVMRGVDPRKFQPGSGYLGATLAVIAVGNFAGGFTAAKITAGRSIYTVMLLAVMMLASSLKPVIKPDSARREPPWYPPVVACLAPLGVIAGGVLQRRRDAHLLVRA